MHNQILEVPNVAAAEIASVSAENGALVIRLRDGSEKVLANVGADAGIQLMSGELYTAQEMVGLFAMPAPEGEHENGVEEANFEQEEAEEQTQQSEQPPALDAAPEGTQEQALMDQLAEELADVETAAGDDGAAGGSNGFGFNSSFASQNVDGIDDIGALGETELAYGLGDQGDKSFDLNADPIQSTLTLLDPETGLPLEGAYEVLEDGSIQLLLQAIPDLPNGVMTITIKGIPPTWTVTGEGTYNATTQTWTITVGNGQTYTGGPFIKPPADSDVDLTGLVFTVVERNPQTGEIGVASTTIDVIVDAVADPAEITTQDSTGLEDTAVDVIFSGALGDKDGSEVVVKYVIEGVPEGFTLSAGTHLGGGVWEVTPDQAIGLKLNPANDFYGNVPLTVTVHTAETVTDRDFDLTNNTATATGTLDVCFIPVADPPIVTVDLPRGEECGCPDSNGLVAQVYEDNTIDVTFSAVRDDGASPAEYLTVIVSGVDLTKLEAGSFSLSGVGASTWTRVPGSADASASFTTTLPAGTDYQGSMHFVPKANSDIDLKDIVVSATAHEPGSDTSADAVPVLFDVIVDAVADKPDINAQDVEADDQGLPVALNITANVTDNDGSESITHYEIKGVPEGFSFNKGQDLGGGVWKFAPADIEGLTITPADATFEGKISLEVYVFNLDDPTDKDFDTTNNTNENCDTFTIDWDDDEPVAVKDNLGTAFDCAPASSGYDAFYKGNLITGVGYTETLINGQPWNRGADATHSRKAIHTGGTDILGKDAVLLTSFTFDGQTVDVPENGSATIAGYGGAVRITLWSNGNYEVLSDRAGSYAFNYTITDADGDCSSADVCFQTNVSPLVLDLDGDGVELLSAEMGVLFDMNNDGAKDQTGWAASDDGLLALDVNGDGTINNQSELFGNTAEHADGFANLAQHDGNGDGVIDANDAIFLKLVVWRDANGDGISDASEMLSLSDFDIASISLGAASVDYQLNGNTVTAESTFTYGDGRTGTLVDAWFAMGLADDSDDSGAADGGEFALEGDDDEGAAGAFADAGGGFDITALLDAADPLQDAIDDFVFSTGPAQSAPAALAPAPLLPAGFSLADAMGSAVDDQAARGATV